MRYKAKLVAKGFLQKVKINYGKVYAHMAKIETPRLVMAIVVNANYSLHQLDVKATFLDTPLEDEIYVQKPRGFEHVSEEQKVYRLKKALYGLKQEPRAWNKQIDGFLDKIGFVRCMFVHGFYVKICETNNIVEKIIICLYVENFLITSSSENLIIACKCELLQEFGMSDLGNLSYFLQIEYKKTPYGMTMH